MAPGTGSCTILMGRSGRTHLSKQIESDRLDVIRTLLRATFSAPLTATIWTVQRGQVICEWSEDVLQVGQGVRGQI